MNKNEKNVNISSEDFVLVQHDTIITDTKLATKPTTFLKDALKRFVKNKSSVVATIILGILIAMTIFVPIFSNTNIDKVSKPEKFLPPKLFNAGVGFWDGTVKLSNIPFDVDKNQPDEEYYFPAVRDLVVHEEPQFYDKATKYGKGGYVVFENQQYLNASIEDSKKDSLLKGNLDDLSNSILESYRSDFPLNANLKVSFSLLDKEGYNGNLLGEYAVYVTYLVSNGTIEKVLLQDYSKNYGNFTINLSEILNAEKATNATLANAIVSDVLPNASIRFELKSASNEKYSYILIENCVFSASESAENYDELTNVISFSDATAMVNVEKQTDHIDNKDYWTVNGNNVRKGVHNSKVVLCDFTYDPYEKAYGHDTVNGYAMSNLIEQKELGYCTFDETLKGQDFIDSFKVLDDRCAIDEIIAIETKSLTGKPLTFTVRTYRYKNLGYNNMPRFLFGTDVNGYDMFKKAFAGLRTSLILGLVTAAFCLVFGLCWGSISGYFGGNIDLLMERFCEILSGIPWIVIMTLAILHLGNNFMTFFLALCMTGWLGTAGRTRTQFYRFKGREYILASRTLGASDVRLIFRHILPNSLGTIITSSVFMIPSVIYSEATLAYLNLGLQGVQSFGVLLSENQQYLQSYPNLVVFPAVIMALMMISFNLFGNGLRDAVNPSLKGSE